MQSAYTVCQTWESVCDKHGLTTLGNRTAMTKSIFLFATNVANVYDYIPYFEDKEKIPDVHS